MPTNIHHILIMIQWFAGETLNILRKARVWEIVEVCSTLKYLKRVYVFWFSKKYILKVGHELLSIVGPLTRTFNGSTTVHGIVSWGRKSCDMHSVYSRVSHPVALNWIQKMLHQNDWKCIVAWFEMLNELTYIYMNNG